MFCKQHSEDVSYCTDYEDEEELWEPVVPLSEQLRDWASDNYITHTAMNSLLLILRQQPDLHYLPKDARTLFQTPKEVNLENLDPGQFWSRSIGGILLPILKDNPHVHKISLQFHIDGLPISHSSKASFWPIQFRVMELPDFPPQIAAIFYGDSKPSSLDNYLSSTVTEIGNLIQNGIDVAERKVHVAVHCIICDSPARATVKGVVNFNHSVGCTKCTVVGEYYYKGHHMSYHNLNATKRTDQSFRQRLDADHHKERSPFEKLPIDMISQFPIADSLHLFDLGIMKRMLKGWSYGSYNFRTKWSGQEIDNISALLDESNLYIPKELHRKVRSLKVINFWKGTEFRTFLLYLGISILRDYLDKEAYAHFLLLFTAVTIFTTEHYKHLYYVGHQIMTAFITGYIQLYGIDSIGSNIHNTLHVFDDVSNLGALESISSYAFESNLYRIKKMLKTGNNPLSQIAKRLGERSLKENKKQKITQFPILEKSNIFTSTFMLGPDVKNKWFLTMENDIVGFTDGLIIDGQIILKGDKFLKKDDVFIQPIKSSILNIYTRNVLGWFLAIDEDVAPTAGLSGDCIDGEQTVTGQFEASKDDVEATGLSEYFFVDRVISEQFLAIGDDEATTVCLSGH
uniref:Transposase domain-containing protein n=1 Tax=Phlebotomus papatasi TaxID=29031 RepID=A0A1B0GNF9_PHLPP